MDQGLEALLALPSRQLGLLTFDQLQHDVGDEPEQGDEAIGPPTLLPDGAVESESTVEPVGGDHGHEEQRAEAVLLGPQSFPRGLVHGQVLQAVDDDVVVPLQAMHEVAELLGGAVLEQRAL